jgi:predicted nucleotidyltransferase
VNKEEILNFLKQIKPEFEKNGIEKMGLFGSFAKQKNILTSDIDIVVKFTKTFLESCDPWNYFDVLNSIKKQVSSKFKMKVDLFDQDSLSPYKQNILKESIYV